MSWNDRLEGPAYTIACTDRSPLRVVAGPGTGKSFAMQKRVQRLLEEGVAPARILAVTFTRNAAGALRDDLHDLGVPGCEKIRAGTLHSFCFRTLGRNHVLTIMGRAPRALITFNKSGVAQYEYQPLLADLTRMGAFGAKRVMTARIRAFEGAWARLQHEEPGWPADPVDASFATALQKWLYFHRAMLIGELVPEMLRYLRNNPGAEELLQYDHIIVDEYQDLNKADQVVLDKLADNGNLAIVGDPDQSIYSFRYAHSQGILEFKDTHPSTFDQPLTECRRCPHLVVELADHLIRNNYEAGAEPQLEVFPGNPVGEVKIVQWTYREQEAEGVAQVVKHLIDKRKYVPNDIIILAPRRILGYGVRDSILNRGIDVHSFFNEEPLEMPEAQEAFALLSLLANPNDRVSLRFWLGIGSGSFNAAEYERLRAYCESNGCSPREALCRLRYGTLKIKGSTKNIQERFSVLEARTAELHELTLEEVVDTIFPQDAEWAEPLRRVAQDLIPKVEDGHELAIELQNSIRQPEVPESGDYVRVMSLHKAKGLTAKATIVVGCMEGVIPTLRDDLTAEETDESLREQRRLFYVAMTRCREILMLSSIRWLPTSEAYSMRATTPTRGMMTRTVASRYLGELGPSAPEAKTGDELLEDIGISGE